MSKIDHQLVGLSIAASIWALLAHLGYEYGVIALAAFAAISGSTAPDWLEIAHAERDMRGGWQRVSVIPHRTFTHWVPLWIGALGVALCALPLHPAVGHFGFSDSRAVWSAILLGFACGGLSHLAADIPNPTGIPVILPTRQYRISLNWWRSGSGYEWMEIFAFWGCSALFVGIL